MKTYDFKGTEVSLNFASYRNNGTLAVEMNTVPDDDSYAVITVNLNSPLQNDTMGSWTRTTCPASVPGSRNTASPSRLDLSSAAASAVTNSSHSCLMTKSSTFTASGLQVRKGLEILALGDYSAYRDICHKVKT